MLQRLLAAILDAVLPPKARTARMNELAIGSVALRPTTHELLGTSVTTLMDYKEQSAQDLVRALKYDANGKAARILASLVEEYLTEELAADSAFSTNRILLIPVPLHASRERERGFNQMREVLEKLPKEMRDGTRAELRHDVIERVRSTRPQTRLPRSERLSNVAGAFALRSGADVSRCRVYLIDDVTTTGATLVNAANPLRRAGADVSLIALARA